MTKIHRTRNEVECECCGKMFMQTRWWQVFCSQACKKNAERASLSEVRDLRLEVKMLKEKIEEMTNNALVHSGTPKPFTYDGENQERPDVEDMPMWQPSHSKEIK